jgi:hypothetical protein
MSKKGQKSRKTKIDGKSDKNRPKWVIKVIFERFSALHVQKGDKIRSFIYSFTPFISSPWTLQPLSQRISRKSLPFYCPLPYKKYPPYTPTPPPLPRSMSHVPHTTRERETLFVISCATLSLARMPGEPILLRLNLSMHARRLIHTS